MGKRLAAACLASAIALTSAQAQTATSTTTINADSASKSFINDLYKGYVYYQQEHFGLQAMPAPPFEIRAHKRGERPLAGMYWPDKERITFVIGEEGKQPLREEGIDKHALELVILHEAGHYWVHQRAKQLGVQNAFTRVTTPSDTTKESALFEIASEGIAEYLSRHALSIDVITYEDTLNDVGFLRKVSLRSLQHSFHLRYSAGYQFVRPILEAHLQYGIDYLIEHPVQKAEPCELVAYQVRALKELKRKVLRENPRVDKHRFDLPEGVYSAVCFAPVLLRSENEPLDAGVPGPYKNYFGHTP